MRVLFLRFIARFLYYSTRLCTILNSVSYTYIRRIIIAETSSRGIRVYTSSGSIYKRDRRRRAGNGRKRVRALLPDRGGEEGRL